MPRRDVRDARVACALFLALACVYWLGRCRTFGGGDSPQHVLSALTWGVSWPPGYPLYVMLGNLFSRLPWGTAAGNVNGLSGLLHALCAALLFLTLLRSGLGKVAAAFAAVSMGLSPLFWYYSEIAEVRALNDLLALAAAFFAHAWTRERRTASLLGLGVAVGLGISHHPTYPLILPSLAYALWLRRPSREQALRLLAAAALSCALPYLILGLRLRLGDAVYNPTETHSWGQIARLFLRSDLGGPARLVAGRGIFGPGFDARKLLPHAGWLLESAVAELSIPGALLAGLGAWAAWRQRREARGACEAAVFWGLWFAVCASCFIIVSGLQLPAPEGSAPYYDRAVLMRFYLLPFLGLWALVGFGAQWIVSRVRPAFSWLLLAMSAFPLLARPINLSRHDLVMDYARAMVRGTGPSDMIVLGPDDSMFALLYLSLAARETGDRVLLKPSLFSYPPYERMLRRAHPGLVLPMGRGGLSSDWGQWMKQNPSRALYAEAFLKDDFLPKFPASRPQGVLLRVGAGGPLDRRGRREARRFLDAPEPARVTRWSVYLFTQEVFLLEAYRALLEWHLDLVEKDDPQTARKIRSRLLAL